MQLMIYMAQNPLSYNKEGSAVNINIMIDNI